MIQNHDLGWHMIMSLALDREFSSSNFTADEAMLDPREKTAKRKGITIRASESKGRERSAERITVLLRWAIRQVSWIVTGRIRFSMTPVAKKTVARQTQSKSRF
jgi:hypothetical protein